MWLNLQKLQQCQSSFLLWELFLPETCSRVLQFCGEPTGVIYYPTGTTRDCMACPLCPISPENNVSSLNHDYLSSMSCTWRWLPWPYIHSCNDILLYGGRCCYAHLYVFCGVLAVSQERWGDMTNNVWTTSSFYPLHPLCFFVSYTRTASLLAAVIRYTFCVRACSVSEGAEQPLSLGSWRYPCQNPGY